MDPAWISLISAMTALVASVLGPIVTLTVARRQFSANVLSANRQRWLESLRDTLAELMSQIVGVVVIKKNWKGPWEDGMGAPATDPGILERIQRIVLLQWKVRLMSNPANERHVELCAAIESAIDGLRRWDVKEPQTRAAVEHITKLSQEILHDQWERVKKGI